MTLRTLLIAGAATLTMTAAFTPAHAGSYLSLEQHGAANAFGSAQHGRRNRLTVSQSA